MTTCPGCGAPLLATDAFCGSCGRPAGGSQAKHAAQQPLASPLAPPPTGTPPAPAVTAVDLGSAPRESGRSHAVTIAAVCVAVLACVVAVTAVLLGGGNDTPAVAPVESAETAETAETVGPTSSAAGAESAVPSENPSTTEAAVATSALAAATTAPPPLPTAASVPATAERVPPTVPTGASTNPLDFPYEFFSVPALSADEPDVQGSGCNIGDMTDGLWHGLITAVGNGSITVDRVCAYITPSDPYVVENKKAVTRDFPLAAGVSVWSARWTPDGRCLDYVESSLADPIDRIYPSWISIENGEVAWVLLSCPF